MNLEGNSFALWFGIKLARPAGLQRKRSSNFVRSSELKK